MSSKSKTSKPLNKKSTFLSRRNVIIYILATICILGIVAGFTNTFSSDSHIWSGKYGETIVMEAEPPVDGTPSDYSLLDNLRFTAYKIHHAAHFRGESAGTASADIKLGTYVQYLTNTRVVDGDTVFAETISTSSLKNIAEQKYSYKNIVVYRPAESYNGSSVTYSNTAYPMTYEDYAKKYGTIPNQLTKYIINEQTIIGVKDENAVTQKAANASANEVEIGFDVPSALVPDADGNYKFTLTLDPDASTRYYRNEVRTLGGADQNPKFYSVKMTITVASDWTPISARAMETYDIALPVLGAMTCTGDVTEYFSEFDKTGDVPQTDFFQPYIDNVLKDPTYVPPQIEIPAVLSPSDYLAAAFGPYLTGEKNLDLGIDVKAGDISAYDIKASINLSNMNVDVALGSSLYARYANDRLYLNLNNINGYIGKADIGKLMKDERMAALVGGMSDFDINSLFGGDMLDTLFAHCEMTTEDGVVCIDLPFELDASELSQSLGKIKVKASLFINEDDQTLKSITGTVKVGGTDITLKVKPLKSAPKMPNFENAVDLSPVLDVIPDAIATFTSPRLGIDGTLSYNGTDIGVSAYIDRTDGLKIDATLNVLGIDVAVKYVDGEIAVNALGANLRGTAADLPELIGAVVELIGSNGGGIDMSALLDKIKLLLPTSVNGYAEMLESLTYDGNTLAVKLNFIAIPIDISLSHAGGALTHLSLGVDIDLLGIKAGVAADLGISLPTEREVVLPDCDSIAFSELTALVGRIKPYLTESNYEISFNAAVSGKNTSVALNGELAIDRTDDGIAAKGDLTVAGQTVSITYADGIAYAQIGNIKVKLSATDVSSLISKVTDLVKTVTGDEINIEMPSVDTDAIIAAIKHIDVKNGVITVELGFGEITATATVDVNASNVSLVCKALGYDISLDGTLTLTQQSHDITSPVDGDEYIDVTSLEDLIGAANDVFENKGVETTATLTVGDNTYSVNIALSFEDGLKLCVTEDALNAQITVLNGTAYIAVGNVRVSGKLSDVTTLFDEVTANLPDALLPYVQTVTSALGGLTSIGGGIDIAELIDTAIAAVTELSLDGDNFVLKVEYNGINAALVIDKALSCMSATVNIEGGTFEGLDTDLEVELGLTAISIKHIDITVDAGHYVAASEFISAVRPLLPFMKEKAFDFTLSATVFGQTVTGNIYVDLGEYTLDTVAAQVTLDVAGVPVTLTVKDKTLYADINGGKIKFAQSLEKAAVAELIARIDEALGTNYAAAIEEMIGKNNFAGLDINDILGAVSLFPIADGFELTVEISGVTVTADVHNDGGLLCGMDVYVTTKSGDYTVLLTAETTDGILSALRASDISIADTTLDFELTVAAAESKALDVPTDCLSAYDIIDLIPSVSDLVRSANGASSLTLDISAMRLEVGGKYMDVTGVAEINLDPIAVRVDLVLFAGTPDAQQVTVVYEGGIAYITVGKIKLSFDINNDPANLFASIKPYLPQSLQNFDTGSFGGLSGLISNIKAIARADSMEQAIAVLFDANNAQGRSTLKQAVDMIELFVNSDNALVASVTLFDIPFPFTVNVSPIVTNGGLDVRLTTGLMSFLSLDMTVGFGFHADKANIVAPDNAAAYVPVVRFVTTVVDAVNTLTAKIPDTVTTDENGNITTVSETAFQIGTFSFDHDTFKVKTDADGNTLADEETGRALIETDADGNKIVERHVTAYGKDGVDALRFSYVTTKVTAPDGTVTTDKKLAVEAHVVIEISDLAADSSLAAKTGFPIELDLYLAPTAEHPEGLAYLYYKEHSDDENYDGMGERISIDYTSALQIVAALMDIVGANDDTVDSLLGGYRLPIDTSVFDSMAIAGFDGIRTMLDSLAEAINEALSGLNDIKAAWSLIKAAPDVDALIDMFTSDDADGEEKSAKSLLVDGIGHIKAAIAAFGTDEDESETEPETPAINGALFGKVVDAVEFAYDSTTTDDGKTIGSLCAVLDNAVATGTSGYSDVVVSGTDSKIDSIVVNSSDELDGLDVNTARLNKFVLSFTTGKHVDISIPADFDSSDDKTSYSDFSKIKHLLFDVMNTANMLEFDIGGKNKNLHISVLGIVDLDITVNAKVKILGQSEYLPLLTEAEIAELKANNNGTLPVYMTAAIISLTYQENKILASYSTPNCTTQLYFFNDIIYVSGVKNWTTNLIGTTIRSINYIQVKYTLDDLSSMLNGSVSNLLNKFVFYLVPLSDMLKNTVNNQIGKDPAAYEGAPATIANIFKGYSYSNGLHTATIGLKELAQNSSLGDVTLSLTGENDDDDYGENANYLNNYIKSLNVKLSLVSIVNITLDAYLTNASTDADKNMVKTPLGDVQLYNLKGLGSYGFNDAVKNVKNFTGWTAYSAL